MKPDDMKAAIEKLSYHGGMSKHQIEMALLSAITAPYSQKVLDAFADIATPAPARIAPAIPPVMSREGIEEMIDRDNDRMDKLHRKLIYD